MAKRKQLPLFIGAKPTLIAGVILALVGIVVSLLNITTMLYFVIAIAAAVCFGISILAIAANAYARKTGRFMPLASYFKTYDYLSADEQAEHRLGRASLKAQLLFLLFEIVVYTVCIGLAFLVVVLWAPTGYFEYLR